MSTGGAIYSYLRNSSQCPPIWDEGGWTVECKVDGILEEGTACENNPCGANAECFLTNDGHNCACVPGYQMIDGSCIQPEAINECTQGTHNCADEATCIDNSNGFTCLCPEGTVGDGTVCNNPYDCCKTIHLDAAPSDEHYICEYAYTQSSDGYLYYHCSGNPEYPASSWASDGSLALVYDAAFSTEYMLHLPRRTDGEHTHVLGGYGGQDPSFDFTNQMIKRCPDLSIDWIISGHVTNATCADYFSNGFCSLITCPENATCTNGETAGSCSCDDGYFFTDDSETVCQKKVNECALGTHNCHELAFCSDTDLGFGCICDDGYDGDGFSECTIVCATGTQPNEDGDQCVDVNECINEPCGANFQCVNTAGSYSCQCDTNTFDLGKLFLVRTSFNLNNHLEPVKDCATDWDLINLGDRQACLRSIGSSTWTNAVSRCNNLESKLPLPLNAQEDIDLYASLQNLYSLTSAWLDGTDQVDEGIWLTNDGSPITFFNWRNGIADNNNGVEHYMQYHSKWDGLWNDHHGSHVGPIVCSKQTSIGKIRHLSFLRIRFLI